MKDAIDPQPQRRSQAARAVGAAILGALVILRQFHFRLVLCTGTLWCSDCLNDFMEWHAERHPDQCRTSTGFAAWPARAAQTKSALSTEDERTVRYATAGFVLVLMPGAACRLAHWPKDKIAILQEAALVLHAMRNSIMHNGWLCTVREFRQFNANRESG